MHIKVLAQSEKPVGRWAASLEASVAGGWLAAELGEPGPRLWEEAPESFKPLEAACVELDVLKQG